MKLATIGVTAVIIVVVVSMFLTINGPAAVINEHSKANAHSIQGRMFLATTNEPQESKATLPAAAGEKTENGDDQSEEKKDKSESEKEVVVTTVASDTAAIAEGTKTDGSEAIEGQRKCGSTKSLSKKYTASFEDVNIYDMTVEKNSPVDKFLSVCGAPIEPIDNRPNVKVGSNAIIKTLKFMLPNVEKDLPEGHRKVFMDLGARMYPKGSTWFFQRMYPQSGSFEAHAFELLDLESGYAPAVKHFKKFVYHKKAAWTHENGVMIKGMKMAKVSDGIESIKNDKRQEWKAPSVDVSDFLMKNFKKSDFIVVKLDIEGGEWRLLPHLIKTGALEWIDELFLECHPLDMDDFKNFPNQIAPVCQDLTNDLRNRGVYAHRWI